MPHGPRHLYHNFHPEFRNLQLQSQTLPHSTFLPFIIPVVFDVNPANNKRR
jgi:hypothetical protein